MSAQKMQEQDHRINVRCSAHLWNRFKQSCHTRNSTPSDELRRLMQAHLRETEPVPEEVEETQEVKDPEALDQDVPVPIQWNVGDYFEDDQGRRGWIRALNAGIAECIVYGDSITVEKIFLSSLIKKIVSN